MLLFAQSNAYTYSPSDSVSIPIVGVAYSGTAVSNYQFSNLTQTCGLSIGSTTGLISGTLTDSVPPNPLLPASCNFSINANANLLDGSLGATWTTSNPIVYRRYMLRTTLPDTGIGCNASTILTADLSLRSWSSNVYISYAGSNDTTVMGLQAAEIQRKNETLDSNVMLIPMVSSGSSNATIARATSNGAQFTVNTLTSGGALTAGSSITNKPGTSTWWMTGTRGGTYAFIAKSTDDGITWSDASSVQLPTAPPPSSQVGEKILLRDWFTGLYSLDPSYYTISGTNVRYKNGVLLVGGSTYAGNASEVIAAAYSTDEGVTWSKATGLETVAEIAQFNLEGSPWVVSGSERYATADVGSTWSNSAGTLWYSDNSGSSWSAASGDFNFFGYDIVYGSNIWIATGLDVSGGDYIPSVRVSTDGSNWSGIDQLNNALYADKRAFKITPPIGVGPILFDGSWNVFTSENCTSSGCDTYTPYVYTHGPSNLNDDNWTKLPILSGILPTAYSNRVAHHGILSPMYVRTGSPITTTLSFPLVTAGGPTVTSPVERSYLFYQYMPISPITFSATGSGQVYFFLDSNTLPTGLRWDPIAQRITGASARIGDKTFMVYAKDDVAVTPIVIQTTTLIPRIVRQQDGAGAYTSLVRQYTLVNAAQNARDNRVFPTQERALGEFAAPPAPDSVTPSNCECK